MLFRLLIIVSAPGSQANYFGSGLGSPGIISKPKCERRLTLSGADLEVSRIN